MGERPAIRLLAAITASGLLHASILLGLKPAPPPPGASGVPALSARLELKAPVAIEQVPVVEASPASPAAPRVSASPPPVEPEPVLDAVQRPIAEHSDSPPLPVPLIVDPTYHPTRELDVFPKPIDSIDPPFPPDAITARLSGSVTLELLIDEMGVVQEARVLSATPEGYFEEAALQTFKAARFVPAQKDGKPARAKLAIQVEFDFDAEAAQQLTRAVR